MGYLIEAIQNDHKASDEDRLSQAFSASFNNSEMFRKLFLKFIDFPSTNRLYTLTQKNFKAGDKDARTDVCIFDEKNQPIIVIENKIDSKLGSKQLRKYNRVKELAHAKRKIALVKHNFEPPPDELGWEVYHWSDLHELYSKHAEKLEKRQIDKFIIQNFVDYLEELQMSNVHIIRGDELKELAKAIHVLRNDDEPYCHLKTQVFETANNFLKIIEQIVKMARKEETISKRMGKNFRFSPWIGCTYYENEKRYNAWIGVELDLRKPFQKISSIATGLYFNDKREQQYEIFTEAYDEQDYDVKSVKYPYKDLTFDKYAYQAIELWKKWLR